MVHTNIHFYSQRKLKQNFTLGFSLSQGSKGDMGLPGPQGPNGLGVVGPPVRLRHVFLDRPVVYCCVALMLCVHFTFRVKMESQVLKDSQEPTANL